MKYNVIFSLVYLTGVVTFILLEEISLNLNPMIILRDGWYRHIDKLY